MRPLRQQCQDMQVDHEEAKHGYDTLLLQLESSMSRLEQEVKRGQEEILSTETKTHRLKMENLGLRALHKRAAAELQLYVGNAKGKRSVRDQLLKLIQEQEKRSKTLKEEQKRMKDMVGDSAKQVKLWSGMARLFEVKRRCLVRERLEADDDHIRREPGTETLVL